MADKSFNTPTALGQFLNNFYNTTVEELESSKAKLVEEITRSLKANYDKQIQNLNEQLSAAEKQRVQTLNDMKTVYEKEKVVLNQTLQSINERDKSKDDIINNYKRQISSLERQVSNRPEPTTGDTNWLWAVVVVLIVIIIAMATCNS